MHCLLIAATTVEINPFINEYREDSLQFRPDIDILVTGIGLTAASYHLTRQLAIRRPDLVIQAGVAGCFDTSVSLGEVLVVQRDTIADQSVVELEQLKTLFDLKLVPANQFPYRKGWLTNPHKDLLRQTGCKAVPSISVNEITTDKKRVAMYRELFNPVTESMEGAALHYACLMESVPFVQFRAISNYIGERNKKKWNMTESIAGLNHTLRRFFESM